MATLMYVKATGNVIEKYPYTFYMLRQDNPRVSFPADPNPDLLEDYGVYPVSEADAPSYDPLTQWLSQDTQPKLIDGVWVKGYTVIDRTAEEIAETVAAEKTLLQGAITAQVQGRLDDFARTRNYTHLLSACTYASSSVPTFAAEGRYCVDLRDQTWAALYTVLAEVEAGTRPVPAGIEDVEDVLPVPAWPE